MASRLRTPLAFLVLGAACFAGGRLSSRLSPPKGPEEAPPPAALSPAPSPSPAGSRIGQTDGAGTDAKDYEAQWRDLAKQAPAPGRNSSLAALLQKMAASDPTGAMDLAHGEKNLVLRRTLVQAVLKGWASTAPLDAANAALTQPWIEERNSCLDLIFAQAASQSPDGAVTLGRSLLTQYPDQAADFGNRLIDALCSAGQFEAAQQFAAGGSSAQQSDWSGNLYSDWAQVQPDLAAQAALAISDPDARNAALHGVVGGWAQADPAGLTQFLGTLPAGGDRPSMLSQALGSWVKQDPGAASAWINNNSGLGSDLDQGVAAVATTSFLKPDVAATWAESVTDPTLRSQTLAQVLDNWIRTDAGAAQTYLNSTTNLLPADRQRLTSLLAVFPNK